MLCSGSLWAGYCADSGCCEVSFYLNFCTCTCYFCGFGFFVFLMLLDVVVCWMVLHGTILVGRLFYVGQRGFEFCWLTYVRVICFHQKGMIASIKIRHPLSFCRANCA